MGRHLRRQLLEPRGLELYRSHRRAQPLSVGPRERLEALGATPGECGTQAVQDPAACFLVLAPIVREGVGRPNAATDETSQTADADPSNRGGESGLRFAHETNQSRIYLIQYVERGEKRATIEK